jgi:hypothetical protein
MSFADIPLPIASFLQASEERDPIALRATLTHDAIFIDRGGEHRGRSFREWSDRVLFANVSIHPIDLTNRGNTTILTVMISGDYGEAGEIKPVQVDLCFTISGDKISALTIDRKVESELPAPVAAYIKATNAFDLDGLLSTFADDAFVNDQLREYWGKQAIREWAAREIIGERVTMYAVQTVEHYGNAVVTANVDGDYDKRGLPDPLVLSFYFSACEEKIVQLIILRNQRDI